MAKSEKIIRQESDAIAEATKALVASFGAERAEEMLSSLISGGAGGKPNEIAYNGEDLVEFSLPVAGMDAQSMKPLFAAVNGETIAVRPGETVRVKRKIADVMKQADEQRRASLRYMMEQQRSGRKPLAEM